MLQFYPFQKPQMIRIASGIEGTTNRGYFIFWGRALCWPRSVRAGPGQWRTVMKAGIDRDHESVGLSLDLGWATGLGLGRYLTETETKLGKIASQMSKIDFLGAKFHCKTAKFQNFLALGFWLFKMYLKNLIRNDKKGGIFRKSRSRSRLAD